MYIVLAVSLSKLKIIFHSDFVNDRGKLLLNVHCNETKFSQEGNKINVRIINIANALNDNNLVKGML